MFVFLHCRKGQNRRRGFAEQTQNAMQTANIYSGLNYTTKEINGNFKMKVSGHVDGRKISTLVGVAGLVRMIGPEMCNKMLDRAFRCMDDKQTCKLRRGIKVTFYYY